MQNKISMQNRIDYQQAGVDIQKADEFVHWIKQGTSYDPRVVEGVGGFAALFRADFHKYSEPCLVSCTDGVGTKVLLAYQYNRLEGIGQDLVAMCVNDLLCVGAEPLFFLDYYAVGKLDLVKGKVFLQSVRRACEEAECTLIGGETAEMPGVYQPGHFDCAGFSVGIVDKAEAWGPQKVKSGDALLGVNSSGFHSNGYSLLRKVFEKDLDSWAEVLLTPTQLYTKLVKALKEEDIEIHAAAHITGGGMDNINRVIPRGHRAQLNSWDWPEPFKEVQKRSCLSNQEMLKTLNCGIGFVLVLPPSELPKAKKIIRAQGLTPYSLGGVI
jgi:phosphoribosylformylglycinamidine cyclo-ligase